ncbi:MAG: DUF4270 domain-containing protein [Prevotellaceae bacterium]|jgi:hypothetical protein|nr:DUF4270 domain-containing protein [Prevotellaceae bacterium]
MNRNLSIILPFLSVCAFVLSCSNEAYFTIGTNWVDTNLKLVYVDSCKAKLSTVRVDSTLTYNQGTILVGKYEDLNTVTGDTLTGIIRAISYIEVSNPSVSTLDLNTNTFFDSLVIEMRFNGFYMGDTLNNDMHLFIHQLEERIKREDAVVGTETYYNTTSFAYNPVPLVETTFPMRPGNTAAEIFVAGGIVIEPVRVKLPDWLGQEMFDKIANKEEEFESSENFLDYFKGLVFVAGDDVKTVIGLKADTTFKINMHYHVQEEFKTEKTLTFSINTQNQFNNIVADRTGTNLLPDMFVDNEIDSYLTGNQSFISAGDGLYTKIEFPNLHDILLTSTYGIVEQAILEIKPVYGTYQKFTTIPASLAISVSNISGEAESTLTDSQGQSLTGSLTVDEQFPDNTRYSFDVTSFVQNQMLAPADEKLFLALRLSSNEMQNSTQRLVIGNSDHSIDAGNITYYNRIKLYLYYNMYNEKN